MHFFRAQYFDELAEEGEAELARPRGILCQPGKTLRGIRQILVILPIPPFNTHDHSNKENQAGRENLSKKIMLWEKYA